MKEPLFFNPLNLWITFRSLFLLFDTFFHQNFKSYLNDSIIPWIPEKGKHRLRAFSTIFCPSAFHDLILTESLHFSLIIISKKYTGFPQTGISDDFFYRPGVVFFNLPRPFYFVHYYRKITFFSAFFSTDHPQLITETSKSSHFSCLWKIIPFSTIFCELKLETVDL